jgi:predicted PurR-regulated permease PerM
MQPKRQVVVNITNRTIFRAIGWAIFAILLFRFMGRVTHVLILIFISFFLAMALNPAGRVTHVLILIFISFFLAMALNPAVNWFSKNLKIKSRVRATAFTYLTVVLLLSVFFALVIPPLVRQTRDFIHDVPTTVENFKQQDSSLARYAERYNVDEKLTKAAKDFTSHYSSFGSTLFNTGKRVAEAVISFFAVLVLTFMMLVEGPRWMQLAINSVHEKKRERYRNNAQRMYKAVTGFVSGQVILAVVAGIFCFIALEIAGNVLDVQTNALAMAGVVTVFGVIPLFGNPIAATVVVLVSALNSLTLAIVMLIYFVVYYFVENHTFQPYLQSRLNELTPLTVFVAALLGIGFGGILGAVIAIPAAAAIKILTEDHFRHRHVPTDGESYKS